MCGSLGSYLSVSVCLDNVYNVVAMRVIIMRFITSFINTHVFSSLDLGNIIKKGNRV